MSEMFHYRVSGMSLASIDPIPGLRPHAPLEPIDVLVELSPFAALSSGPPAAHPVLYASRDRLNGAPLLAAWRQEGGYRLRYAEGAEFVLDGLGRRVEMRWDAPLTGEDAVIYLLGPVLGFLLRLRGVVPLHASAVVVDGRAIVFSGAAGSGKSTTAAAYATLGHSVLADDVVRVAEEEQVLAYPSHPRVGIWPETADAMFGPDALPRLSPTYSKRYLDVEHTRRFHAAPAPIEVIYLLGDRAPDAHAPEVRDVAPREALLGLACNTYGNYLLDASMRAREFDVLSRMVTRIPVRRLRFGDAIDRLTEGCRALAAGELSGAGARHR